MDLRAYQLLIPRHIVLVRRCTEIGTDLPSGYQFEFEQQLAIRQL